MELKLYDTLTREKRVFAPIDPKHVRMYVCGPTVYDFAHIGNARPVIVFDVLYRLLRHLYGAEHVKYVRNITDVDDKINARAAERGISIRELTEETYENFKTDVAALGCLPPDVEPRATEHIEEMKALIERLVASKNAYVAEDHVLFSVPSMKGYGQLSKRPLDEMIAGARVDVAPYKHDPMDFVLWKPSKPGEPGWPSPAGITTPGRPGWHIECSAMSWKYLGESFDIHGGGIDLVFPHHENEIAQTCCAFHSKVMANVWMHNEFLEINGKKMSKSEGNFITIHDLLKSTKFGGRSWRGDIIRFAMLQTRYGDPIDWTVRTLEQSESRLEQWRSFSAERMGRAHNLSLRKQILDRLCDNLDTPAILNLIDQVCKNDQSNQTDRYTVNWVLSYLGFESEKLPTARAVDAIAPVVSQIVSTKDSDWRKLFNAAEAKSGRYTERQANFAKFLASLAAIGELPSLLQHDLPDDLSLNQICNSIQNDKRFVRSLSHFQNLTISQDVYRSEARSNSLNRIRLAKKFDLDKSLRHLSSAISALAQLTTNDWRNLAENVRQRPRFANGELRPETQLFVYLWTLSQFQNQMLRFFQNTKEGTSVTKRLRRLIVEIRPQTRSVEQLIQELVDARNLARKAKNFAESDRIRDELAAMGVVLKDSKDGTTWEVAR